MVELTKPNPLLLDIPIIDKDYLFFNFNSWIGWFSDEILQDFIA